MEELQKQYVEYKDVLARLEEGDYDLTWKSDGKKVPYTIEQILNMKKIVDELDDMGFHLIYANSN